MKIVNVLKHISDKLSPEQIKFANDEIQASLHPLILKYENKIIIDETTFNINKKGDNSLIENLKYSYDKEDKLCKVFIFSNQHYKNDIKMINLISTLIKNNTPFLYYYFKNDFPEPIYINYFDFFDGPIILEI